MPGYVNINLPPSPIPNSPQTCSGNPATLTANGTPEVTWFTTSSGGIPVATGFVYTTPPLTSTTTYYVESDIYPARQHVGPVANSIGGGTGGFYNFNYYRCEYFDALKPFRIVTVKVYPNSAGIRTIVFAQGGIPIQSVSVNLPSSPSTPVLVMLNFDIPVGNNWELGISGNEDLFRNTAGSTYPYTLPGLASIKGDISGVAGNYYFFYDWELQEPPCTSPRIPVTVIVGAPIASYTSNIVANVGTFTNTSTGAVSYHWDFGDAGSGGANTSNLPNPTHTFTNTGSYTVCLTATDGSGCTDSSCQTITITQVGTFEMNADANISVFPNPVSEQLTILFSNAYAEKKWTAKLTDILGKVVGEKAFSCLPASGKYNWDLSSFAPGAYTLILESDNGKVMKKIVRE